jgi:hypothetical protein
LFKSNSPIPLQLVFPVPHDCLHNIRELKSRGINGLAITTDTMGQTASPSSGG